VRQYVKHCKTSSWKWSLWLQKVVTGVVVHYVHWLHSSTWSSFGCCLNWSEPVLILTSSQSFKVTRACKSGLGSITEVMTGKHASVVVRLYHKSYSCSLLASKRATKTLRLLALCLVLFKWVWKLVSGLAWGMWA
jgi:hypothetical protein